MEHHLLFVVFPELSKACEQLSSKGEERGSDHRGMQSEALAEELQIVKSQCDKLTTEHQQTKALCRQLQSERDVSDVTLWDGCIIGLKVNKWLSLFLSSSISPFLFSAISLLFLLHLVVWS